MNRIKAVTGFFRSGECVCPFTQYAELHFAMASSTPRFQRIDLRRALIQFSETMGMNPAHSVIVVRQDGDSDFDQTRQWARAVYLELNTVCALISHPLVSVEQVETQIEREVKPVLFDDSNPRRPSIILSEQPTITICLAPCYPRSHPRWAPVTLLSMAWHIDIALAQTQGVVKKIREKMLNEHGILYDADELMLPLPKGHSNAL